MPEEDPEEQPEDQPQPALQRSGPKFWVAMTCYAAIALLAWLTLEGRLLWVVWIFLGWFAIRTYITRLEKP